MTRVQAGRGERKRTEVSQIVGDWRESRVGSGFDGAVPSLSTLVIFCTFLTASSTPRTWQSADPLLFSLRTFPSPSPDMLPGSKCLVGGNVQPLLPVLIS
jgi:hypothetical protein